MNDDIVARLRVWSESDSDECISDMREAADEIERLRSELDETRRQLLQHLHPDIQKAIDAAKQCDCSNGESCH